MRKCPFCSADIQDGARACGQCGRSLIPGHRDVMPTPDDILTELEGTSPPPAAPSGHAGAPTPDAVTLSPAPITRVSVVDINMPFPSMVGFMVKWALAAIPAILILVVLGVLIAAAFAALGAILR